MALSTSEASRLSSAGAAAAEHREETDVAPMTRSRPSLPTSPDRVPPSRTLLAVAACALLATPPAAAVARAQGNAPPPRCRVLCAPTITLMPGVLRTHLARGPLVRSTTTGAEHRLAGTSSFEAIVAVGARTPIPHLGVYGSVQWLPNASEARNPFTLYTASDLGTGIKANAPTADAGVTLALLPPDQTGGWLDLGANVGDLLSQAARPTDRRAYTHKLDLELVTHVHAFAWSAASSWLHRTSLYAILDYVATGLPKAGDEVPVGRRFVSGARPLALVFGLALPVTEAKR